MRRRWLPFLAATYLIPLGWVFRNQARTGHAVFSSMESIHLYDEAGLLETTRTGRPASDVFRDLQAEADRSAPAGYANDVEKSLAYARIAMPILRRHPELVLKNHPWGAVKLLGSTGTELFWQLLSTTARQENLIDYRWVPRATGQGTLRLLRAHRWLIVFQIGYSGFLICLYAAFAAGILICYREGRHLDALYPAVLPTYFLIVSSHVGSHHYRLTMMPTLTAGVALFWTRRNKHGPVTP